LKQHGIIVKTGKLRAKQPTTNILVNNAGKNGQDFFCGINGLPDIDHFKQLIFQNRSPLPAQKLQAPATRNSP
jgi:hypothetical protein